MGAGWLGSDLDRRWGKGGLQVQFKEDLWCVYNQLTNFPFNQMPRHISPSPQIVT